MNPYRKRKMSWVLVVSVVLFTGCSPTSVANSTSTVEVVEVISESDQATSQEQGQNNDESSAPDPSPENDDANQDPGSSQAVAADQACIYGTWQTVPGTVADYLSGALNENTGGAITFGVEDEKGELVLKFDESGQMEGLADEYQVTVTIEELNASIDIVMVLSGSAEFTADGTNLTVTDPDYDAEAVGEGLIAGIQSGEQTARIELTPGSFSAQAGPISMDQDQETGGSSKYTCQGNSLILEIPDFSAIEWERVD